MVTIDASTIASIKSGPTPKIGSKVPPKIEPHLLLGPPLYAHADLGGEIPAPAVKYYIWPAFYFA